MPRPAILRNVPCASLFFRGLQDDILFVEKAQIAAGIGHLPRQKIAMLAARDCHEPVADSRFVECLMDEPT
jgi:hypothetical protein